MTERFVIGKIINAHGIRGEVKVFPITDDAKRFKKLKKVILSKDPEGDPGISYDVESTRIDKDFVLVKFRQTEDRTAAEKLKGLFLSVGREDAVKLPEDRFFIADLIGLEAVDDDIGSLGVVNDVYETGANSILSIRRSGKRDLQVPFLKTVCYEVDTASGIIRTRLPEGLYEIYETSKGGGR